MQQKVWITHNRRSESHATVGLNHTQQKVWSTCNRRSESHTTEGLNHMQQKVGITCNRRSESHATEGLNHMQQKVCITHNRRSESHATVGLNHTQQKVWSTCNRRSEPHTTEGLKHDIRCDSDSWLCDLDPFLAVADLNITGSYSLRAEWNRTTSNLPAPVTQHATVCGIRGKLACPRQVMYHYAPLHSDTALLPTCQEHRNIYKPVTKVVLKQQCPVI